jgi:uncharacterized protein
MGGRDKYTLGAFSWSDLTTTDQEGAKRFYSDLFRWTAEDQAAGEGVIYSMMKLDGSYVAAISPQPEQQREAGVPPAWNSYVTVDSADDALSRAQELGAAIHAPAFDVFDAGRIGVVQDPQGAFFLVWQPKAHVGASLVNAPGALSWNELATPDMDASAKFYSDLFGWTFDPMEGMQMPYKVIKKRDGTSNGGMRLTQPGEPPYWLVYFGSDDVEQSLEKAGQLGASTVAGPMPIGPGQIAIVRDPQGAVFALYAGHFEP